MSTTSLRIFVTTLSVILVFLAGCNSERIYEVKTQTVHVDSVAQIEPLADSLVKPILYAGIGELDNYSFRENKDKFIALILPAILVAKHEREMDAIRLKKIFDSDRWSIVDSIHYRRMLSRYESRTRKELELRMQTLPNSVVLAQAAVESGWGTSRFFIEARNVFGIWSFNELDTRIEASKTRGEKKVFVRSYKDLSGSVRDYFDVLGTSNAFRGLRLIRKSTNDPYKLLPYLKNYSERKGNYTRLLKNVIRQNKLTDFDRYHIHPDYLEEVD